MFVGVAHDKKKTVVEINAVGEVNTHLPSKDNGTFLQNGIINNI